MAVAVKDHHIHKYTKPTKTKVRVYNHGDISAIDTIKGHKCECGKFIAIDLERSAV